MRKKLLVTTPEKFRSSFAAHTRNNPDLQKGSDSCLFTPHILLQQMRMLYFTILSNHQDKSILLNKMKQRFLKPQTKEKYSLWPCYDIHADFFKLKKKKIEKRMPASLLNLSGMAEVYLWPLKFCQLAGEIHPVHMHIYTYVYLLATGPPFSSTREGSRMRLLVLSVFE